MKTYPLLEKIQSPADLRKLDKSDLPEVCNELRDYLIDTLAAVGGHFSSNLGVIELTVALHYVMQTPVDKLIWDVGHQIYPHKILTGRRERLRSVRRFGGISGFPKREESPYDLYNTGHAGTSISQMLGEAVARDIQRLNHKCVCIIGDASIASGMSFEALNHGGHVQTDCVVVLNDNDMSISHNVGALNQYLNRMITSPLYNRWRKFWYGLMMLLPVIGPAMRLFSRKVEKSFKDLMTPGSLFSDFGFRYIGPVDGHDVLDLVRVFEKVLSMKGPILVHVYTQKGKGFKPAENNPITYHSVSVFNREDGSFNSLAGNQIPFSDIVGMTLAQIVEKNDRVVAVTPAMIEGSGLRPLYDRFPEKVYDVGIAEQHAMTFAGALAAGGVIPYLCIYSTFLNRALDQLIQDVALMNLPVRIVIDRAGCVGPDGETHQGLYDAGIILSVPSVRLFAPATGAELKAILLHMEKDHQGPLAVRFPKAGCNPESLESALPDVTVIRPSLHRNGHDLAIVCIGTMVDTGMEVEKIIRNTAGILSRVIGVRWIRPLDAHFLEKQIEQCEHVIFIEESYIHSSATAFIRANISSGANGRHLHTFAFPEESIPHGGREEVLHEYDLSPQAISSFLLSSNAFRHKIFAHSVKPSEIY